MSRRRDHLTVLIGRSTSVESVGLMTAGRRRSCLVRLPSSRVPLSLAIRNVVSFPNEIDRRRGALRGTRN